ncbi:MAG TPA: hypothetical protein VMM12_02240 [Longimicrobiales bacterium]|nr:hypothetical protein [Longimicrobiales bacterium]
MARISEHHLRTSRTARFIVCGDPAAAPEAWFVLHGYRQLAERFVRPFLQLPGVAEGRRAIVAPEALNRFYVERDASGPHGPESRVGAAWMTRADREHEIRDYVEYLDRIRAHARPGGGRTVVLGFSQGAETASRWAVLGAMPPHELVLWGGGLAADVEPERAAAALARTAVTFVVGDQDAWAAERADAGLGLLAGRGVAARRVEYAGGHRIEPQVLASLWP